VPELGNRLTCEIFQGRFPRHIVINFREGVFIFMKRPIKVMGAAILSAALLLGACGGGAGGTTQPAATPPPATPAPPPVTADPTPEPPPAEWQLNDGNPATISMSWWGGDARHDAINAALQIFMDRYPHITVDVEFGAFTGWMDNLSLQLAGRIEPDIMQVNYAWVHSFGAGTNVFLDLNTVSHIIDLTEWSPEMLSFTTTADGQLGGVPHGMTGRVIVYSTEMLAEAGLSSFPSTFDEWIALGPLVSSANLPIDAGNNTYPFFPLGPETLDIVLLSMLYNETGRNLQANGQMLHTVDEVERMFDVFQQMIDSGTLPTWEQQEPPHDATNPVWMSGRGGSVFEWVGNIFLTGGNFMDNNPAERHVEGLGVALLPAVTPGGGQAIMQRPSLVHAISRNSNHPEVAAYLLNFLYTDEDALLAIAHQLGVPLSRTAANIAEREGMIWGLQLEGLALLNANVGTMCPMFEDPNMRPPRLAAIEGFRTRDLTARQAAENWVNHQQNALNQMS